MIEFPGPMAGGSPLRPFSPGYCLMSRGEQSIRQWKLVTLLSGRYGKTLAQLTSELNVTTRTVQRDLVVLESSGFPLESEKRNGTVFWRLTRGFESAVPISLTREEAMALHFCRGLLDPLKGTPIYEALESALGKIARASSPRASRPYAELEKAIAVSTFGRKDLTGVRPVFETLTRAIFNRLSVRLSYQRLKDSKPAERTYDPYTLWFTNNGLYVVGLDHYSREIRTLAVERIRLIQTTNQRFEIPEDYDFDHYRESAFQMVWGEAQEVKIWFAPDQAAYIEERIWHPSQKIEKQSDGSIVMTLHVADPDEVERWLFGFGDSAKII